MPKPKDAKIWNEDLVAALEARYQQGLREQKRDALSWRKGCDAIQAVRKDIYQFRTGAIVNLPRGLSKRVERLCEDIIRGVKNVYPDGHLPTNRLTGGNAATTTYDAVSNHTSGNENENNPFLQYHYTKSIKIRGGAYAILMAFYHSPREILRKAEICREGQKFCDDQMESNYHAGRTYGAWTSIKTLKSHHFVKEQGFASYGPRGFRDRPHEYSLTNDGRLFVQALFAIRPEARKASEQASGGSVPTTMGGIPSIGGYFGDPSLQHSPIAFSPGCRIPNSANKVSDRKVLENWIASAQVGDVKEFNVGKDRRKYLHNVCDVLQQQKPGLLLVHGSTGISRGRTLRIQMVSRPHSGICNSSTTSLPDIKPPPPSCSSPAMSSKQARENAGRAAMKRAQESKEEIDIRKAILESKRMAAKIQRTPVGEKRMPPKNLFGSEPIENSEYNDDLALKEAIQLSLNEPSSSSSLARKSAKRKIFSIESSSDDSDIEGNSLSLKRRRLVYKNVDAADDAKKPAAKIIHCIDDGGDDNNGCDNEIYCMNDDPKVRSYEYRMKNRTVTSEELTNTEPSIDLCDSADDENINDCANKEVIDLHDTQEETIDLSKSQDEIVVEKSDDDDDVIIVEPRIEASSSSSQHPSNASILNIVVDNRERNRNATPRMLKTELQRHLLSGPLYELWPASLPLARVAEERLEWGDFQFRTEGEISGKRLGISVERKRVNDLVQRSSSGDHLSQLFRMQLQCSLSVLLVENDTRMAAHITPYDARGRDTFDPFNSTIENENDVFRMFGRLILSSSSKSNGRIKFWQTRDEQSSLRAIGALGLMALHAPPQLTRERKIAGQTSLDDGIQALNDKLTQAGIPWRIAKRVSAAVGSLSCLTEIYNSCGCEEAKSMMLSHVIATGSKDDKGDLRSSPSGWSDAIFRIVTASKQTDSACMSGQAALLLHKDLVPDHGTYLSTFYKGYSHVETLERVLEEPPSISSTKENSFNRKVIICLTKEQAKKYFGARSAEKDCFYNLSISSGNKLNQNEITMQTVCESLSSQVISIFEMEGADILTLIREQWTRKRRSEVKMDFIAFAKTVAALLNSRCNGNKKPESGKKRVLMVCGLQAAMDSAAKKPGYAAEMRAVLDLVFAELLLCYDLTIVQALRKKTEDRVSVVQQIALSCYHYGFLVERKSIPTSVNA